MIVINFTKIQNLNPQICNQQIQFSKEKLYPERFDNHGRNEEGRNRRLEAEQKAEETQWPEESSAAAEEGNWKRLETYRTDDGCLLHQRSLCFCLLLLDPSLASASLPFRLKSRLRYFATRWNNWKKKSFSSFYLFAFRPDIMCKFQFGPGGIIMCIINHRLRCLTRVFN